MVLIIHQHAVWLQLTIIDGRGYRRARVPPVSGLDFYSARNARIASAVLAIAIPSVCLSVRLSVTRRYCVKTAARSKVQFAPLDSKMCLVL